VYVKTCFVTPFESNVNWSKVRPCAWCIIHAITNCRGNRTFVIMCNGLSPICNLTIFSIGI
jgi:hypothetical protein